MRHSKECVITDPDRLLRIREMLLDDVEDMRKNLAKHNRRIKKVIRSRMKLIDGIDKQGRYVQVIESNIK